MRGDHTCAALLRAKDAVIEVSGTNADEVLKVSRDLASTFKSKELQDSPVLVRSPEISRRVFIVHGHDDGPRESVARFLERLGFDPIILREQPNKGRTIITKFREEAANVGFAIVLMTPDDHGGQAGTETQPRARQNVVFELGFFIGALGPERVAALVKGKVERPSDFDGVAYISLDQGSWKTELGKELEAAGFEIDWSAVMRA
jgi:predicted nucleotide-binding protein